MSPKPTWKHKGRKTSGGGVGARNQFVEDPNHGSGSNSYVRNTKPSRDSRSLYLENVTEKHSMNTQQRLHHIEQNHYVYNDRNMKHERECSMELKPFNKWNRLDRITEETRKRPRLGWNEGIAKLQEKKIESATSAATPTSVDYGSLSGLRTLKGGDGCGSESNGRNTRAPRDPRPQFLENVRKKDRDNVVIPSSNIYSMKSWGKFEQHYDKDENKKKEGESSVQLNPIKRWSRYERFYHGETGKEKEKDKNTDGLEKSSNEIEESRKRRRLNWGEGLSKYEKKKREVEGLSVSSAAVAAIPTSSSVACSFLSGEGDILHVKTTTGDTDSVDILSTSVVKLLESADLSSSLGRSNAMTKVLIWKTIISKVLEETQTKISSLENELMTIESESQSGHSPEALPIAPSDDGNIEKMRPNLHREDTLCECETIISCNREIAKGSNAVFDKFYPKECHKVMCSGSVSNENAAIKEKLAEKEWFGRFKEKVLITKYKALDHLWKKDMLLRSLRNNSPTSHSSNDCLNNRSFSRHRFPFPGKKLSLVPTSEMINFTSQLWESQNEVKKRILKMPSLILDEKDKMTSMFKSRNGVVEDPVAVEKERVRINPWTSDERKIYVEKFRVFGKDFRKIASFLDHKTIADCVEFYYKSHKLDCFEQDKKRKSRGNEKLSATKIGLRRSGRKRNVKVNVVSQKKLSETPLKKRVIPCTRRTPSGRLFLWRRDDVLKASMSDDINTCISNSNSLAIVVDQRERVSTDVLVGLCDSLPKSDTNNKNGDWRNLNHDDESQHEEDRDKVVSIVSNESIIVQDIMQEGDETMKFVPTSKVLESLVNEVNVVETKLDTNKNDDQRNLSHDESQPEEDGNVSKSMEIRNSVSNECVTRHEIMELGDEVRECVSTYERAESPMIEVNGAQDEVNTCKNEDQRNLNHDEFHLVEDRNASESTEVISMISNECIVIQDILEDGDEDTKFVPTSEVVESLVNEVSVVEPESNTNEIEDERNLNHDESPLVEDGIVSESKERTVSSDCIMEDVVEVGESLVHEVNGSRDVVNIVEEKLDNETRMDKTNLNLDESELNEEGDVSEATQIVSVVYDKCVLMQDTMDEGDEATKFVPTSVIVESPVNEVNDARDEVKIVEAESDTNKKDNERNLNHDGFQTKEDGNVSESTEIINTVSGDCTILQDIMEERDKVTEFVPTSVIVESPLNEVNVVEVNPETNNMEDQRNLNHDGFQPVESKNESESTEVISTVSSDHVIMQNIVEEGEKVSEFVPASEIVEFPMNEVNVDRDEVDEDQSNLKHEESQAMEGCNVSETTELEDEVTKLVFTSETVEPCQTHSAAEILVSENTIDTSVLQEITTLQHEDDSDKLNSMSIGGDDELHKPGISLKEQVGREVKTDICCSSSSTASDVPQNIEQTDEHDKADGPGSSDSEIAPTNPVVFKLFGKVMMVPSSAEKHDLTVMENGETGEIEDLADEQVERSERPKRRVSEPKYLKDYFRFK
ncbi:uncharacterized protein HKW66_Vig0148670 [Vigna angularis]|uniref:SANT domain-containing protein n=1 Tax=Phaseolus angularis TaxID=3914 RepID=A0A8T0JUL1_PHAAN|nr:uncharacterized protein HKW66_Vig0148670 [Vigna angularis]